MLADFSDLESLGKIPTLQYEYTFGYQTIMRLSNHHLAISFLSLPPVIFSTPHSVAPFLRVDGDFDMTLSSLEEKKIRLGVYPRKRFGSSVSDTMIVYLVQVLVVSAAGRANLKPRDISRPPARQGIKL
jgi:hypothetical protein